MSFLSLCMYLAVAGVASHLGYFIHGEHHREAPAVARIMLLAILFLFNLQYWYLKLSFKYSTLNTIAMLLTYLIPLWTSMLVYRLFFHRLRKFRGPLPARISRLWYASQCLPNFDSFRTMARLHKEYGDFVRTGPNEISTFDPAAVAIVLTQCTKGPVYDQTLPMVSVLTIRDPKAHAKRRRIWDMGFNTKALQLYDQRVMQISELLLERLDALAGQVIDLKCLFYCYTFDLMGATSFGHSYNALENLNHFGLDIMEGGAAPFAFFSPIPWALPLLTSLPGNLFNKEFKKFIVWSAQQAEERKKVHKMTDTSDIMENLIEAYNQSQRTYADDILLGGDTRLITLSGTETSAGTLIYTFYFLAKHPEQQKKLRDELFRLGLDKEPRARSRDSPHLDAVIKETLRLWPPVLSGLERLTPPEGITIGKTYIPGNVTIRAPAHVIHRLESCYVKANDFIPERWYSQPWLIKDNSGYAPWGLGPASCVGKQAALNQLRATIALLVTRFEVSFAPGTDGSECLEKTTDHFALSPGSLKTILTKIEKSG